MSNNRSLSHAIAGSAGYTFLELILAMAVGSIVLAASYSSYTIVAREYERVTSFTDIQENGIAALQLISRDLRMAGYKALDANLESSYGRIATPIAITDSGNACCDSVKIIYDKSTTLRQRFSYYVLQRNNPTRYALYLDVETWDGAAWNTNSSQSLVVDYVEDLQFSASDLNSDGNPQIVDMSLVVRSKSATSSTLSYTKPSYDVGNYNLTANDPYRREDFSATINIRNLRE